MSERLDFLPASLVQVAICIFHTGYSPWHLNFVILVSMFLSALVSWHRQCNSAKNCNESGGAGRLFPTSSVPRDAQTLYIGTWSASKCRLPLIKSASNFGTPPFYFRPLGKSSYETFLIFRNSLAWSRIFNYAGFLDYFRSKIRLGEPMRFFSGAECIF